ncbi:hypothetical protein ACR6C2_41490 [Streptomyces sp. INA 01156]
MYSAPHTQVLLRAGLVTSGLAVEVEDRGLGMPMGEQERMNALLADPDQVNVASLLADGRIGLFVVSQLAKRHGIHVRLQSNIYGGVQAVLVVPQALLGAEPWVAGQSMGQPREIDAVPDAEYGGGPTPRTGHPVPAPGGVPLPGPAGYGPARCPVRRRAPDRTAAGTRAPATRCRTPRDHARTAATGPPFRPRRPRRRGATPAAARRPRGTGQPGRGGSGVNPDDRRTLAENGAGSAPLTPRDGTVHGTTDKPRLPRRRAQEHLVPQLRDGPAPRQETEHVAGHDPHLVAAFQRGVSLAETQQPTAADDMGATPWGARQHRRAHGGRPHGVRVPAVHAADTAHGRLPHGPAPHHAAPCHGTPHHGGTPCARGVPGNAWCP